MGKLLTDFLPLAVFFVAYKAYDLTLATIALMFFTCLCLAVMYLWKRKLAVIPLISGLLVGVFGALTIWLHDEQFIKMKPTIVNLIFSLALWLSLQREKPLLPYVLESAIQLTPQGWRVLTRRYARYFLFLAVLNEIIWRNFPTDFWVDFKVFGVLTLTIVFTLCQIPLWKKYALED